jgi:hypothetical protein
MEFNLRQYDQVTSFLYKIGLSLDDKVCLVVIKKANASGEKDAWQQRFVKVQHLDRYLPWLRYENAHDGNIYITPCKMQDNANHRTKENFLPKQRVMWLDLDSKTMIASVLFQKLLTLMPVPTCVVRSSKSNYQAYWVLASDTDFARLSRIMEALNQFLQLDHTHDISRVLRLPGFRNHKLLKDGMRKNDMCYLVEELFMGERTVTISGQIYSDEELSAIENNISLLNLSNRKDSLEKKEPHLTTVKVTGGTEEEESPPESGKKKELPSENGNEVTRTQLDHLYHYFASQVGQRYRSSSEADMAFVCSAIRRGFQEERIADTLKKYVDSTKHCVSDYVRRTYHNARKYLDSELFDRGK